MSDLIVDCLGEKTKDIVNLKINELSQINKVYKDILTNEKCDNCEFKNEQTTKILPIINSSADIMIITENATQKEIVNEQLLSDPKGKILLGFLNKLDTDINDIYITPITKCYSKETKFNTAIRCASKYIIREILHVKPKLIITIGELTMKIIKSVFFDIPNHEELKIATERKGVHKLTKDISTLEGLEGPINFVHTISPKRILLSKGEKRTKFKKVLWHDLKIIDQFKESIENKKETA